MTCESCPRRPNLGSLAKKVCRVPRNNQPPGASLRFPEAFNLKKPQASARRLILVKRQAGAGRLILVKRKASARRLILELLAD